MSQSYKYILVILTGIFVYSKTVNAQHQDIIGKYRDDFGSRLELKADSSFKYTWHFDLVSSWNIGKWAINDNQLTLTVLPVLDTLRKYDKNDSILTDSLFLSIDQTVEVKSNQEYLSGLFIAGGQGFQKPPSKLYFKNEKLYLLKDSGRIDRSKEKSFWTRKRHPRW